MANISQFSTTAANNNSASPDGAPEGMAPSGVNDTMRENMAAAARWYQDTNGTLVTAGTGAAFTITTNSSHAALGDQSVIVAAAHLAPSGAATLAVDGLAAKPIKINHDEDVDSSTWEANQMLVFIYNATDDVYEVTGPSIVGDGTVTTAKLADGAVTEAKVTSVPFPRGHIGGLQISIGTDTAHDIDIAIGGGRDAADSGNLTVTSTLTKQIDASWAVGTGAGGMATAVSLSPSTWYHLFLVDLDAGGTDAGFDTDVNATNLLATTGVGTRYRRIGSVFTDGSSNIIPFIQTGDKFVWDDAGTFLDINGSSSSTTAALVTTSTPPGVKSEYNFAIATDGTSTFSIYFSDPDQLDVAPTVTNGRVTFAAVGGASSGVQASVITNTSRQVRWRSSDAGRTVHVSALGWTDQLGRWD